MGFSRQEYWSGLPFPPPGDLPNPGIKPTSPALAGGFFTAEPPGLPYLKAGQRPEVEEQPERQGEKKNRSLQKWGHGAQGKNVS